MDEAPRKKVHAEFFQTTPGVAPVREKLRKLGRPVKTQVGEGIRFVELNWRLDRPYVDRLRSGKGEFEKNLYEARHTVLGLEYRTLFFIYGDRMVLVHFFRKNTRKTPPNELEVGWSRMKLWVREERMVEVRNKKRGR